MIKHVRTGLQTRPGFQSYDRSGGTALESRPHMFNRGSTLLFGCGRRPRCDSPWNPWRFFLFLIQPRPDSRDSHRWRKRRFAGSETSGTGQFGLLQRSQQHMVSFDYKISEADLLLCTCGGRMRIISFITDPRVVDRILRHRESKRSKAQDPFEPRPPPHAVEGLLQ